MQIVINAGGTGTRLWPATTAKLPKQFIKLIDEETLLQKTYRRLLQNFSPEQIWVNTNLKFRDAVIQNLPDIDPSRVLCEPEKRDTYASICSHSALVAGFTSTDEQLVFVHADHQIPEADWGKFNQGVEKLGQGGENYNLLCAGIKPEFASTQFGYIQIDPESKQKVYTDFASVVSFKEKPDQETAQKFFQSGNYLWNLGYFGFSYNQLIELVSKINPQDALVFEDIKQTKTISIENYQKLPKVAFDIAVVEKIDGIGGKIGTIGMDIAWQDLGNWQVLADYMPEVIELGNENFSPNSTQIQIAGTGNKAKTTLPNRKVAFIGVSNLVLIETEEGILVLDKTQAGKVKDANSYFENQN